MWVDVRLCTCSMGLDPKTLSEIINIASGRCWSSDTYNPCPGVMEGVPASNNYQGGFRTGLMAKVENSLITITMLYCHIVLTGLAVSNGGCRQDKVNDSHGQSGH